MNIDKKKLREAIAEINHRRKTGYEVKWPHRPDYKTPEDYLKALGIYNRESKRSTPEWATQLYSLQAHSRGRLHVRKEWVPTYAADGGLKLVVRTMEDQAKLIAPLLAEFEMSAEQIQARQDRVAQLRAEGRIPPGTDFSLAEYT